MEKGEEERGEASSEGGAAWLGRGRATGESRGSGDRVACLCVRAPKRTAKPRTVLFLSVSVAACGASIRVFLGMRVLACLCVSIQV